MKRGDIVTISMQGDYGKPRPALIIQSDLFDQLSSRTVLPITSDLYDAPLFRIAVQPNGENGLRSPSQIMIDKLMTVRLDKIGPTFGRISDEILLAVNRALLVFLGLA